jgi:hypothetical protein
MASFSDRQKFSNFFGAIGRLADRLVARWREATAPDRYRPEKHYMRGPGPKNSGPKNSGPKNSGLKKSGPENPGRSGSSNSAA